MELNNRQQQILKQLLDHSSNGKYCKSLDIAKEVNTSVRTVKTDIGVLKELVKNYGGNIISKPGQGYFLEILDNDLMISLSNSIRKTVNPKSIPKYRYERVNYIIKKLLSVDYYLTLDDFIDELYVSRSTITADMKEVREVFKDYNLKIVQRPNYGIILEGSEISKRLCIAEYFFHQQVETGYFAADNAMFVSSANRTEMTNIQNILRDINSLIGINMSDQSFQNYVIHILIAIRRWRFYDFVNSDMDFFGDVDPNSKEYLAASLLVERIEKYLNILLPDKEKFYFYLQFKSKHNCEISALNKEELEIVEMTFYDIYRCLSNNFRYIVTNKHMYEQYLRLHIPPMVERLKSGMVMRNSQKTEILTKYPCSVHVTLLIAKIIEDRFDVRMNQSEFAYLVLYTNLLFDFTESEKTKALVVCGRGRPETVTLLTELNESELRNNYHVDITNITSLTKQDMRNFDLIISTVPIDSKITLPIYYLTNSLAYIDEITTILKYFSNKQNHISDILDEAVVRENIQAYSRDEIFKEVEKDLGIKGLAIEFWEAEHIISHETNDGTVFLHVIKPLDIQVVYFASLKKSIIWNKQWVRHVVFVNITGNLKALYQLYSYINETFLPKWAVETKKYIKNDEE